MINIQEAMKELFGNSCLAYSMAYYVLQTDDVKTLTEHVLEGWKLGYIDNDGYVSNPLSYMRLLGRKYKDVEKVKINSLTDLKADNTLYVVEYVYGNGSHFVVVKNQKVIFDPAGDSNTVKKGRPYSWRKYIV